MKLSQFIMLSDEQKKSTVLHQGVFIAKRNDDNYMLFLFQLESYYVETWWNRNSKALEEYRVFDSLKPLAPYLETIAIEDLFA